MSNVKAKLAELGRRERVLILKSRDGLFEVPFYYKRPTSLKDRVLRETMSEEYAKALAKMKEPNAAGIIQFDSFKSQFMSLGADKCAAVIVNEDYRALLADATKTLGREQPVDPKSEEAEQWWADIKPIIEANIDAAKEALLTLGLEELANRCTEIQVDKSANLVAFEAYRINLVLDSIYDKDADGNLIQVYSSREEIEDSLPADIIEDLSIMVQDEVRKAREIPLKSAATN